MPKSVPLELATAGGCCNGVDFIVEAALYDIGFALVTAVAIDGRAPIEHPVDLGRACTLDQALDRGKEFAAAEIGHAAESAESV